MQFDATINPDQRFGIVHVTGAVTRDEYEPGIQRLLDDPRFTAGMALIFDLRQADLTALRADDFRHFQAVNQMMASRRGVGRSALVVSSALQYGMMRMYGSLAATANLKNELFHSVEDAVAWATGE